MRALPRPGEGFPPYGILSDSIIGDVIGRQARTVCKDRERLGFPAVTQRHRERQWLALQNLWGVEAAERFLARSPAMLAAFRQTIAPKDTAKPFRPFVTVPKTSPDPMSSQWGAPVNPEAHAAKHGKKSTGKAESVEEFLARGGAVTRVPSGVVTESTLRVLAQIRDGFPRAGL